MFNIGTTELIVIAGLALLVLGPEKFPGHAKIAMRFMRDIRSYWDDAKRDIANEIKPLKKELKELQKYKPEDYLDAMTGQEEDSSSDPYGTGYTYSGGATGAGNIAPTPTTPAEETEAKAEGEAIPTVETPAENGNWQHDDAVPTQPTGTPGPYPD